MTSRRGRGGSVALALALTATTLGAPAALRGAATGGPCDDAAYRALDDWIGEWRLVLGRRIVAESRIESAVEGCALQESWNALLPGGRLGTGRGWLYRDPAAGAWHAVWVDSLGRVIRGSGTVEATGLVLDAESLTAGGSRRELRIRFIADEGGRRQLLERPAPDGGWTTFREIFYEPPEAEAAGAGADATDEAEPGKPGDAPPPTTTPDAAEPRLEPPGTAPTTTDRSPAPAEGAVRVLSGSAADERVELASPMVLEVPLGRLDAIPAGYAWRTTETARFSVQGISIARVGASKRLRGGVVELSVSLRLHGERYLERADVEVALLPPDSGAEPIARRAVEGVAVGLSVPSQMETGAVERTVTLELDPTVFDRLFQAGEPALRITVSGR